MIKIYHFIILDRVCPNGEDIMMIMNADINSKQFKNSTAANILQRSEKIDLKLVSYLNIHKGGCSNCPHLKLKNVS